VDGIAGDTDGVVDGTADEGTGDTDGVTGDTADGGTGETGDSVLATVDGLDGFATGRPAKYSTDTAPASNIAGMTKRQK
jgi:hypothetical protein